MVDLGTRTATEVATLAVAAARLVRARGPLLVTWFCLGWTVHQGGLFLSALLGAGHVVLANLVFVLAVVAKLVSLVLMVHAVRPNLPPGPTAPTGAGLPGQVLVSERTIDVVTLAVGPFLALYALWGFVDDEVSALFLSNYQVLGLGDVTQWSISVGSDRLPFYLGLAASGWVLRLVVRLVLRRRPTSPLAVLGVLAEAVWTLGLFVVLLVGFRAAKNWLRDRVVWAELTAGWNAALDALPDLTLPFGATVRGLARALVEVAPGVLATVLLLPLLWLALAATVYGWRDHRAGDVVAGTRAAAGLDRLARVGDHPVARVLLLVTADLRDKYVPVAQALRLIGRAGPRFVGAYLLLATGLSALEDLLRVGLSRLVGPRSLPVTLLLDPAQDLLVSLVVTVASVALYAAAFARAVQVWSGREVTVAAPAPAHRP